MVAAAVAVAVAVTVAVAVAVAVGGRGTVRSAVSPPIRAPSSLRAARVELWLWLVQPGSTLISRR